jgi:hypothetical protein
LCPYSSFFRIKNSQLGAYGITVFMIAAEVVSRCSLLNIEKKIFDTTWHLGMLYKLAIRVTGCKGP